MKAAVFHGAGNITVESVPDPRPEPDGVVIRVKACGICGSDLHFFKMNIPLEPGLVMGHEFSGDVVEVGSNMSGIKAGDRVTAHSILPCGKCTQCQNGQFNRCLDMKVLGYQMPGAFAEYVSIPLAILGQTIFPLPAGVSYEAGATVEPLSVGETAVRRAEPRPDDTVVILGAGMIGQCALQVFKSLKVSRVIVSEVSKKRLEVAKATGADVIIDASCEDPVQRVRDLTSGIGADIVVECAGIPATFQQALNMVRGGLHQAFETEIPDGKVMIVAVYEQPIEWTPITAVNNSLRLIACFAGRFPSAIELLAKRLVDTSPLVTHEFLLSKAKEAFETQLKTNESIKVLIKP